MSKPQVAQLRIFGIRFFRESCNKSSTGINCSISDRPAFILKTTNKSFKQSTDMRTKSCPIFFAALDNLSAYLSNASASSFPYSMVICLTLTNVVRANSISVFADDFFSLFTEDLAPCFNAVDSNALGDVVSV